ncbi:MAG: MopE-related protein [Pseudomonadota bacterium]
MRPLPLAFLLAACNDVNVGSTNKAPEVSLRAQEGAVVMGSEVTFHGTATDPDDEPGTLTVAWTVSDSSGHELSLADLDAQDDCTAPPADSATARGEVACTLRAPSAYAAIQLTLEAWDPRDRHAEDSIQVDLSAGSAPTCSITQPDAEGVYFSDEPLPLDGTCADALGETAPEDLLLWYRDTYRDADGQTASEEYRAGDGDTAADDLTASASATAARLYGYLPFTAGDHVLCLLAEDESGNVSATDACVAFTVYPPNADPWCEILLPLDGTTGGVGAQVHFEALVGDPDLDDATGLYVEWRSDLLSEPIGYGTPDEDGFLFLDQAVVFDTQALHNITLYVEDAWGADGTCSIRYRVADGPSVAIASPTRGDLYDLREAIPLECTYSDGDTACADMLLAWELFQSSTGATLVLQEPSPPTHPSSVQPCSEYASYDPATLGELDPGSYHLYCRVTDGDGNENSDAVFFDIGDCTQTWYRDLDGDGYGDATVSVEDCTQPPGYVAIPGDCDDSNVSINPGEPEQCNGLDDNCDGTVDGGFHLLPFYRDADGDGYGDDSDPYPDMVCSSATLPGYAALGGDCDDTQPDVNPGEPEQCDDTDHDCDGDIDNGFAYPYGTVLYLDADSDGYGAAATTGCTAGSGLVLMGGDCDDGEPAVNPGATEVCDAGTPVDDDCDGDADPVGAAGCTTQYLDADGDGYGTDAGISACVCASNPGAYTSTNAGDCDDGAYAVNPGATEVCDAAGTDEDCDGLVNGDDPSATGLATWYRDADADGCGLASATQSACDQPTGSVADDSDCDDTDASVHPGSAEVCDTANADEDCDGLADDSDSSATGQGTWYRDADGDGYGSDTATLSRCDQPSGYVASGGDCNDSSTLYHPGASEPVGSGTDYDCSGGVSCYNDDDNDGYLDTSGDTIASSDSDCTDAYEGSSSDPTTDCDDFDASAHPGATETCDGADNDCDGATDEAGASGCANWYYDYDNDNYGTTSSSCLCSASGYYRAHYSMDCDDGDSSVHPGATETCDGADEDCDGTVDEGVCLTTVYSQNFDSGSVFSTSTIGNQTLSDGSAWQDMGLFSFLTYQSGHSSLYSMGINHSSTSYSATALMYVMNVPATSSEDLVVTFWIYARTATTVGVGRAGATTYSQSIPANTWTEVSATMSSFMSTSQVWLNLGLIPSSGASYSVRIDDITVEK